MRGSALEPGVSREWTGGAGGGTSGWERGHGVGETNLAQQPQYLEAPPINLQRRRPGEAAQAVPQRVHQVLHQLRHGRLRLSVSQLPLYLSAPTHSPSLSSYARIPGENKFEARGVDVSVRGVSRTAFVERCRARGTVEVGSCKMRSLRDARFRASAGASAQSGVCRVVTDREESRLPREPETQFAKQKSRVWFVIAEDEGGIKHRGRYSDLYRAAGQSVYGNSRVLR